MDNKISKIEIPSTWQDASGRKRHLIEKVADGDETIVVSKTWLKQKQYWTYVAETEYEVKFVINLVKKHD